MHVVDVVELSEKYHFRESVPVTIEEDASGRFIAEWEAIEAWGEGVTIQEAIDDLKLDIIQTYHLLNEKAWKYNGRLGPRDHRWKEILDDLIVEANPPVEAVSETDWEMVIERVFRAMQRR